MTRDFPRRRLALVAAALFATGCGSSAPKIPLALAATDSNAREMESAHALLGPAAQAALDSGNALFRQKAYQPALAKYRRASELAPQHAAPLFGIYMVARATNDAALADSAMAGIRARNGNLPPVGEGTPHAGMSDSALKAMHAKLKTGAKLN